MNLNDYDKFVRRFVKDYVNNLTPDQMRNHLTEQFHIDLKIYVKILVLMTHY